MSQITLCKNQNPWGQGFFGVDLTWNNSIGEQILNGNVLLPSTKMETIDLLIITAGNSVHDLEHHREQWIDKFVHGLKYVTAN